MRRSAPTAKVPAVNLPPVTGVTAIAGLTGSITAIGARTALSIDAVDNTPDIAKPISIAQQTALDAKSAITRDITTYTGSVTLALADRGRLVFSNAAAAHTLTIPTNATVAFRHRHPDRLCPDRGWPAAIAPAAGVTLNSDNNMRKIRARYTGGVAGQAGDGHLGAVREPGDVTRFSPGFLGGGGVTTWNPADKTAGVILSNLNLRAAFANVVTSKRCARLPVRQRQSLFRGHPDQLRFRRRRNDGDRLCQLGALC